MTLPHKRKLDEAVWVRDGEIAKKKSVDEREDSYVCAYAQGEREYGNDGEAGILAQGAQGIAQIPPELAHGNSLQKTDPGGILHVYAKSGASFKLAILNLRVTRQQS